MSDGHSDPAARRSLLDLPDIDLPCPLFMILPDPSFGEHQGHDGGSLRVFRQFAWLEVGSVKAALSRPTHQQVPRDNHTGQAASRWAHRHIGLQFKN
jgi:hypothetical protein